MKPVAERIATTAVFLANGLGIGAWAVEVPRVKEALSLSNTSLGIALFAWRHVSEAVGSPHSWALHLFLRCPCPHWSRTSLCYAPCCLCWAPRMGRWMYR
jgi:hypothetical protein